MREMGHLSGPDIAIRTEIDGEAGAMMVAVGDRIMTLANDKSVGVQNGTTGRVNAVVTEPGKEPVFTMATDGGRMVTIDTATYRALSHGYAATLHKSQGVTVSRAWLLHHRLIDRHLAYVALSRHKADVRVYAAASDAPTLDALARQYAQGRTKDAVSDYVGGARTLLRDPRAMQMPIRQAIGAAATAVRDFGQRLRTGLAAPFRITTTQELSYVHARSLAALEKIGRDTTEAVVVEATEREAMWLAAAANLEHGLPLKSSELRQVFRAYVRARKHVAGKGKLKSYRDIAPEIGKPASTIYRWMLEDFPQIAAKMSGNENFKGAGGLVEVPPPPPPAAVQNTEGALRAALEAFKDVRCPTARGELINFAEQAVEEMKKAGQWEAADF